MTKIFQFFISLFFICYCTPGVCQSNDQKGVNALDGLILTGEPLLFDNDTLSIIGFFPEVMPQFVEGGEFGLQDHISRNIVAKLQSLKIKQLVLVELIINKIGDISGVSILKGLSEKENQIIRDECKKLKFKPGLNGNRPTDVKIIIPINF